MLTWLYHRIVSGMERRYAYDAAYLHEFADRSPPGFRRFLVAQSMGRYRGTAPRDAWFAGSLAGALHEDCGPCVQIVTDMALEAGVPASVLHGLIGGGIVPSEVQLAFDYARALLSHGEELEALREEATDRFGLDGLIAITMAAMYSRNFPLLKRAMGHAKACQRVMIRGEVVSVQVAA